MRKKNLISPVLFAGAAAFACAAIACARGAIIVASRQYGKSGYTTITSIDASEAQKKISGGAGGAGGANHAS